MLTWDKVTISAHDNMEFWCLLCRFRSFSSRKVTKENKCIIPPLSFLFWHALLLTLKADTIVIWVDKPLCSWSGIGRGFNSSCHRMGLLCLQRRYSDPAMRASSMEVTERPWCTVQFVRTFLFFFPLKVDSVDLPIKMSSGAFFSPLFFFFEGSQAKYVVDYWYQIIDTESNEWTK